MPCAGAACRGGGAASDFFDTPLRTVAVAEASKPPAPLSRHYRPRQGFMNQRRALARQGTSTATAQ